MNNKGQIVDLDPSAGLRLALHFKLFKARSFRGGDVAGSDPREALIADVTGDDRKDLIRRSHDRILVLPQDPGPDDTPETNP